MNKIVLFVVSLLVGLGLGFMIPHGASQQKVGGVYNFAAAPHMDKGLYVGTGDQFSIDGNGNASSTGAATFTGTVWANSFKRNSTAYAVSSSSPAALGAATAGQFVVAANATSANASSTAITASSLIFLQNSATTTIPGVTCNTTIASSTQVSSKLVGNGFIMKVTPAPSTNPYCFDFHVTQ